MSDPELQKLEDLYTMGFIQDEEYERRKAEILGTGCQQSQEPKDPTDQTQTQHTPSSQSNPYDLNTSQSNPYEVPSDPYNPPSPRDNPYDLNTSQSNPYDLNISQSNPYEVPSDPYNLPSPRDNPYDLNTSQGSSYSIQSSQDTTPPPQEPPQEEPPKKSEEPSDPSSVVPWPRDENYYKNDRPQLPPETLNGVIIHLREASGYFVSPLLPPPVSRKAIQECLGSSSRFTLIRVGSGAVEEKDPVPNGRYRVKWGTLDHQPTRFGWRPNLVDSVATATIPAEGQFLWDDDIPLKMKWWVGEAFIKAYENQQKKRPVLFRGGPKTVFYKQDPPRYQDGPMNTYHPFRPCDVAKRFPLHIDTTPKPIPNMRERMQEQFLKIEERKREKKTGGFQQSTIFNFLLRLRHLLNNHDIDLKEKLLPKLKECVRERKCIITGDSAGAEPPFLSSQHRDELLAKLFKQLTEEDGDPLNLLKEEEEQQVEKEKQETLKLFPPPISQQEEKEFFAKDRFCYFGTVEDGNELSMKKNTSKFIMDIAKVLMQQIPLIN